MDERTLRLLRSDERPLLEGFLHAQRDSSIFLLANARTAGLEDGELRYQGAYLGAFQGERLVGVVAHYWNGMLVLQAPGPELEALVSAQRARSPRALRGLIGPAAQVERARAHLDLPVEQAALDEPQGLYGLDLARLCLPAALDASLRARRARPGDEGRLAQWKLEYSLESLGEPDRPALRQECAQFAERAAAGGSTWVLESEGERVAMSSFNAELTELVQVGGVWTPPTLRGRGYARAVVGASLRDAQRAGCQRAVLFTGESNAPAVRAYAALGFERVGDYRMFILPPPGLAPLPAAGRAT